LAKQQIACDQAVKDGQLPVNATHGRIPTSYSYFCVVMQVTEKGQVTIPKTIREAAGVTPGSQVSFSLEGSKIVITPVASGIKDDRRAKLKAAAAKLRKSFSEPVRSMGAEEIMQFIRGEEPKPKARRRATR
jgi:antitoxin PrlF